MSKTRRSRMQELKAKQFTGRTEQIDFFNKTLDAVEAGFIGSYEDAKTIINISGEGGMGKTTLLREFERICRERKFTNIFLDMRRREGQPIRTLVDFMRLFREWFRISNESSLLLGRDLFDEFDEKMLELARLEGKVENVVKKSKLSALDQFADLGSRVAVGLGKDVVPFGQTAVNLIGEEHIQESVEWGLKHTVGWSQSILLKIFGKKQDVDFYLARESILIEKFAKAIAEYVKEKPAVLFMDSYEDMMHLDRALREQLLAEFPQNLLLVFTGRNSIYDNCDLLWRGDTHFIELREFDRDETFLYLERKKLDLLTLKEAIYDFTGGVPLAVAIAAQVSQRLEDVQEAIDLFQGCSNVEGGMERRRIIEEVAERFIDLVDSSERHIIDLCAILGRFNRYQLESILQQSISLETFEKIEGYSFIRRPEQDYLFHDIVRAYVLHHLQQTDHDGYKLLHKQVADFYIEEREKLGIEKDLYENETWKELTLALAYHQLQSEGTHTLYKALANAFWEAQYKFARSLINVVDEPPKINVETATHIENICVGFLERQYELAESSLLALQKMPDTNPHLQYIASDILGEVYANGRMNKWEQSIYYFERAVVYCEKIEQIEWATWTKVNIARQYSAWGKHTQGLDFARQALHIFQSLENKGREAYTHTILGEIYRKQNRYSESVDSFSAAEKLFTIDDDLTNVANVLWELGITCRHWEKYEQSLTYLKKSQDVYESLGQTQNVTKLSDHIAITYRSWGKYSNAIEDHNNILALYQDMNDQANIADILWELGITYRQWKKYEESITYLRQSQDIYQSLGQLKQIAHLSSHISTTYREWGKYSEAVETYNDTHDAYKKLGDQSNSAYTLYLLGLTHRDWGKYAKSVDHFKQSQNWYKSLERQNDVVNLSRSIANTYYHWNKHSEAIIQYTVAKDFYIKQNDESSIASILFWMGIVYNDWGKYEEALSHLRQSETLYKSLKNMEEVLDILQYMAVIYRDWEKYEEAIEQYQMVLDSHTNLDEQANIAKVLKGLGNVYRNWGKYDKAVHYYTQSRNIYISLDDQVNIAGTLRGLGNTHRNWGKYDKAIDYYTQSQNIYISLDDQANIADTLRGLATVCQERGQFQQSVAYLKQSIILCESLDHTQYIAYAHDLLGITYHEWGKYVESIEEYMIALRQYEKLDDKVNIADVMGGLGIVYRSQKQFNKSLECIEQSLSTYLRLGLNHRIIDLYCRQARTRIEQERYEDAQLSLQTGLDLAKKDELQYSMVWCYEILVKMYGMMGEMDQARENARIGQDICDEIGGFVDKADIMFELGKAERDVGNAIYAQELLDSAFETYQEFSRPIETAKTWRELGKLYGMQNKIDDAKYAYQQSLNLFIELDIEHEIMLTRELI